MILRKRTPKEIGDTTEERAKRVLQGQRVTQSGGGRFFKSDVRDLLRIVWEVKGTDQDGFRITKDMLRKARDAARGMRGTGDRYMPGMVVGFEDKAYVVLELEDYAHIITAVATGDLPQLEPSKAAERRARTRRSL